MAQNPGAEPGHIVRNYGNGITVIVSDVSYPRESFSGTLSRLRNLYPRFTQNTEVVSSINFLILSISCPFTLLFNSVKTINIHVI